MSSSFKRGLSAFAAAGCLLSASPARGAEPPESAVRQLGTPHRFDQVLDWHCLVRTAVGFELRPCLVEVAGAGGRLSAPGIDGVEFLLRGVEGLVPGPVRTVFSGQYLFARGATLPLGGAERRSRLTAEPVGRGFDVVLAEAGVRQVLAQGLVLDEDVAPLLLWAGDLDRDGRLDYLLDRTDPDDRSESVLFLSRAAGEGELVRRVAVFRTAGC